MPRSKSKISRLEMVQFWLSPPLKTKEALLVDAGHVAGALDGGVAEGIGRQGDAVEVGADQDAVVVVGAGHAVVALGPARLRVGLGPVEGAAEQDGVAVVGGVEGFLNAGVVVVGGGGRAAHFAHGIDEDHRHHGAALEDFQPRPRRAGPLAAGRAAPIVPGEVIQPPPPIAEDHHATPCVVSRWDTPRSGVRLLPPRVAGTG